MNKKLTALLAAAMLVTSLTACSSSTETATTTESTTTTEATTTETTDVEESSEPVTLTTPVLLTSAGQSADYQMIGTVMTKLEMDYEMNNLATSADLEGYNTLIVVSGGSSKGLGAAGVDTDGELARLDELMGAAQDEGIAIIVMHTGGAARRGDLSDKFITPVFPYADYAVVVEAGDEDGLMAGICADNNIPLELMESISDVVTVLPEIFE